MAMPFMSMGRTMAERRAAWRKGWGLASALALAGCSSAPAYRPPQVSLPASFAGNGPWVQVTDATATPPAEWWTVFGDPVLDGLEQQLNAGNPSLAAAVARHDRAMALLHQARADLYPQLGVGASVTQNRQSAVRDLSKLVDVILVVGAQNSSNSNRLREIGAEEGIPSYLIADGSALQPEWVKDAEVVGLTAGASAPEVLVDSVIDALGRLGPVEVSTLPGREEHMEFRLPAELTEGFATRTVSRAS